MFLCTVLCCLCLVLKMQPPVTKKKKKKKEALSRFNSVPPWCLVPRHNQTLPPLVSAKKTASRLDMHDTLRKKLMKEKYFCLQCAQHHCSVSNDKGNNRKDRSSNHQSLGSAAQTSTPTCHFHPLKTGHHSSSLQKGLLANLICV